MAIKHPDPPGSGLLLVNKPRGITSFGVIARLRKMTGIRRIGHAGTLDPFAEGLLVVALGRATAAVRFMDDYDKTYDLEIEFGRTTNTLDLTGQTLTTSPIGEADRLRMQAGNYEELRAAVQRLAGERQQTPPMFSAVKIGGRPLYEFARRGQVIERASRPIRIYTAEVLQADFPDTLRAKIRIACSKGTYIRSLAGDLGEEMGCGALAAGLVRLQAGPFHLANACGLEELQAMRNNCPDQPAFVSWLEDQGLLLPLSSAFSKHVRVDLAVNIAERLINGQIVDMAASELFTLAHDGAPVESGTVVNPQDLTGRLVFFCRDRLVAAGRLLKTEEGRFRLKTERVLINLADLRQT